MAAYPLTSASVAAIIISLGFVFIFPDLGQAQTGSQRGDQGQVYKGTKRTDQGQARKNVQRATQGNQVRKNAQNKSRTAHRPAQAGVNDHDGSWRVSLRATSGVCAGQAASYAVQVRNGNISYGGGDGAGASGHVSPSGAVSFHVVNGDRGANGSGHVSRSSGGGSWQGHGSGVMCTGTWVASR
jgi:hypothetical protein